ncbi:Bardet-Biedl syndrome 7 protein homolog [Clytia hemisphaerica]|uniref:Bardet-Biedl syndrome 7 protein homolog n=1 Tax=Clytia hemisphaerica TaxID=252671 RepID=A0A7M5VC08_9CNID|eukprot:TCONS_00026974-protein
MLALNLSRVDYLQVGVTSNKCMSVIPTAGGSSSKPTTQRIVVGDYEGVVTCFNIKKHVPNISFKTLPLNNKILRLCMGARAGPLMEKVYVCSGNEVYGFNKKGKGFLKFDSNLTESIQTMYADNLDLYLCGKYICNHYHDCIDSNYYLSPDLINDIVVLPESGGHKPMPILACQDRVLRALNGSDLYYEVEIPGSPSVAVLGSQAENGADSVVYGTADGKIGLVQLNASAPEHVWEIGNEKQSGDVLSLDLYDVSSNGTKDLLVGRADGVIEVYGFDEGSNPFQHYKYTLSESITAVSGGSVCAPGYQEVAVSTYTGWILGLTSEPQQRQTGMQGSNTNDPVTAEIKQKITDLNAEIEELQGLVLKERDKYQQTANSKTAVSAVPMFEINDRFQLNHGDASYTLSIEVLMPIDIILLQSDVPVDLLDVEKNSAVVSYSSCDPESGNFLLATYRCQANTTRLELKIRTIEGQHGHLQAYITPRLQPKTCIMKQYQIKPLSLHQRSHVFDQDRPHNELKLSGQFSQAEIHSWVYHALPEVPERVPMENEISFYFVSTFLDTQLECRYSKGQATFRSDNISTISILKDVLSKEATKRKMNLNISCDLNEDSIPNVLYRIHPKLEYQLLLAKRVQLIDGLKELETYEGNVDFLTEEYREILENADILQAEFKKQPCHLERLYGMITDLYIDRHKFKGQNVKNKVSQLISILDNYDLDSLLEFFQES